MKKILMLFLMVLMFISCHNVRVSDQQHVQTKNIKAVEKEYNMNIDEIKKQLALQSHIEASEDNNYPLYNYTVKDLEVSLPVIAQGLKDNNFIALDKASFNEKIKFIFGDIFHSENPKVKLRDKFNTIFVSDSMEEDEFDYTIDNIFIAKEYGFITYVPLIADFIHLTDSNHYNIEINPPLIARNKYLLNNSKADLAYLLSEDSLFLKTLVRSFGYTKEPAINNLVMNDYMNLDENHIITIGEIIFIKNSKGVLEIKEELLKWIADHTRVNDNRALEALDCYAYALFNSSNSDIFTRDPYRLFSVNEKRKIVAYIANTYLPLYYKLGPSNPAIWPAATIIENQLVEDEGLADYLKKNNYFSLPALKHEMEPEN